MDIRNPVLAICVAGTPAPGINGVISAVTIEALNSGCSVLGFYEGFKQMKAGKSMVQSLEWNDVTRIYNKGGSILRTSKHQITNAQELDNCLRVLEHHRVRYLVAIGGTQTAYSASLIASASKKSKLPLSVVHVPKTVFNDLPLPADCRTFGYSTAREEGMKLVQNFANDARTMLRWYILVCMGQKAGHLSLGIGKAGAATLTLIPEDYEGRTITFNELATTLEATMIKRRAMNKDYGVVVLAEGLSDLMDKKEIADRFGNADNGHQELGRHLVLEISQRFKAQGIDMTLVCRNIGNELRSADPNSADIILTRDLGFGATRFLMEGGNNCMITYKGGSIYPIPLSEMLDIANNSTLIRCVDVHEMTYQVAQSYMIKLMQSDLADMAVLTSLAKAGNMTPAEFVQRFKSVATAAKQYQSVGALQYSLRSSTSENRLSISGGVHTPSSSGFSHPASGATTPVGSVTFTSTPLSVESAQQALNAEVSVEHTQEITNKQAFLPTD